MHHARPRRDGRGARTAPPPATSSTPAPPTLASLTGHHPCANEKWVTTSRFRGEESAVARLEKTARAPKTPGLDEPIFRESFTWRSLASWRFSLAQRSWAQSSPPPENRGEA